MGRYCPLSVFAPDASTIADRLLYALPLRSLASSLFESTRDAIAASGLARECPVRLQTGETTSVAEIGDPKFSNGRIIFCTIDQILSSYLCTPFSLPIPQSNLNAGALVGGLVVFDEYHLLDPNRSLRTAFLLNQHLAGLCRLVWMTATQSTSAIARMIAPDRIDAIEIEVPSDEIVRMPSQRNKNRLWKWLPHRLTGEDVWRAHKDLAKDKRRTIVVLNTVSRAQAIYRDLKTKVAQGTPVILLHSRFLASDRSDHESAARAAFGRSSHEEAILVATQVVEAGLDLSASYLHTELAPANALVQRAGRCARFEGENGQVFVYDSINEKGSRSYSPYATGTKKTEDQPEAEEAGDVHSIRDAMDRTALLLTNLSNRHLSFAQELSFVDSAHSALDLHAVESFDSTEWRRRAAHVMTPSKEGRNYSAAADLIRDIDTASIILADEKRLAPRVRGSYPDTSPQPSQFHGGRLRI